MPSRYGVLSALICVMETWAAIQALNNITNTKAQWNRFVLLLQPRLSIL